MAKWLRNAPWCGNSVGSNKSGHEHFNGSLVVPVMDENGTITEVYSRKLLGNKLRKGTPQHQPFQGDFLANLNSFAVETCGSLGEYVFVGGFFFGPLRFFLYFLSFTFCASSIRMLKNASFEIF